MDREKLLAIPKLAGDIQGSFTYFSDQFILYALHRNPIARSGYAEAGNDFALVVIDRRSDAANTFFD